MGCPVPCPAMLRALANSVRSCLPRCCVPVLSAPPGPLSICQAAAAAAAVATEFADTFGDAPMVQSKTISGRVWSRISGVGAGSVGKSVLIRGRIHAARATGSNVFIVLRQAFSTIQVRR
jgi:hypothetical protein